MRHLGIMASARVAPAGGGLPVSGAVLWLDASDTSSITASGGAVSQWNDKSGNGFHVSQSTAGAKPTTGANTLNGMNVLTFDGGDHLNYAGTTGVNVGAATSFVVFLESSEVANAGVVVAYTNGANDYGDPNCFATETGGASDHFAAVRDLSGTGNAVIAGTGVSPAAIYAGRFNPSGLVEAWKNGGTASTSTRSNTFGTAAGGWLVGGRYLGSIASTNKLNGCIAEIVVYDTALSTSDINLVGNYLERWGHTWTDI